MMKNPNWFQVKPFLGRRKLLFISFSVEERTHQFRTKHTFLMNNSLATECNAFQLNIGVKSTWFFCIHIRVYVYGFRIVASCCYWGLFSFSHIQLQCCYLFFFVCSVAVMLYEIFWYTTSCFFYLQTTEQTMEIISANVASKQIRSIMRYRKQPKRNDIASPEMR